MMDGLHSRGNSTGSRGLPDNQAADMLSLGPVQQPAPIRGRARIAQPGTALGSAALQLVRGSFFRNLATVVTHAQRTVGVGTEDLAAASSGAPPAPSASGWDGQPLSAYGQRGGPAPPSSVIPPVKDMTRTQLFIAWLTPGVPPPGPFG